MDKITAAAIHSVAVQWNADHGGHAVSSPAADAASLTYDEHLWQYLAALGSPISPPVLFLLHAQVMSYEVTTLQCQYKLLMKPLSISGNLHYITAAWEPYSRSD